MSFQWNSGTVYDPAIVKEFRQNDSAAVADKVTLFADLSCPQTGMAITEYLGIPNTF